VNLWMKRAFGAAVLGGGLLALGAGTAGAQEVSADASARVGRPTTAQVRVCADGRDLSGLLGSCSDSSGSSVAARAGDGIRVRARLPRASADAALGARRRSATASAQGSAATRPASADASADAAASLSRPRAARLLALRPLASLAGVGLLGSSPFTLAGDPASGTLLPTGELTLDDPAAEVPAGIGVLDSGPIASGDRVDVEAGDVSPSVPVMVCGNGVGVLGDASAGCGPGQPAAGDSTAAEPTPTRASASTGDALLDGAASGSQVDAGIGSVSASAPVTVCGNAVGDATASCAATGQASADGTSQPSGSGGAAQDDSSAQGEVGTESVSASLPVMVCGDGVGVLGDASVNCASDTSTGGIVAPPPGTTPGSTGTDGTTGSPGSTGTSGIPGTIGLTPGTGGDTGDPTAALSPVRPSVASSGSLAFTGAASDLLAAFAAGLLVAGVLIVRVAWPATAATEGGEDR